MVVARGAVGQRQNVSGFSFTLQPQVNRVSADVEEFTGFAFLQSIELDGLDHLLTEIVTVRFSHSKSGESRS